MLDNAQLNYSPAFVYRKRDFFSIIFYWREDFSKPLERYRRTFGLNRIADLAGRENAANIMAGTITEALKSGWNPNNDVFAHGHKKTAAKTHTVKETLPKALTSILNKSKKSRTHTSYQSHYSAFSKYLQERDFWEQQIAAFDHLAAIEYQDYLISLGYANKTINTKVDFASGLFRWAKNARMITDHPFDGLQPLPENSGENEEALFTLDELQTIKKHLLAAYPELWQCYLFIHYCYMRPSSIVAIQLRDIDLKNGTIQIAPDNHKNSKKAEKQLLQPHLDYLAPYLQELSNGGYNPDTFIFSNGMKPGAKMVAPTRFSELWKLHVKDVLGITKNAYNGKHTGGTMFIEQNDGTENLKWLQQQMSHSDLQTTSIYVNKRRKIKIDESKSNILTRPKKAIQV